MKVVETVIHFDQMTWPRAGKWASELQWRLRYAQHLISSEDMLMAASIICAYEALINKKPATRRNYIINKLQEVEKLERRGKPNE